MRQTSSAACHGRPSASKQRSPGHRMALALWLTSCLAVLRHDPGEPDWPDRDRFILSNRHRVHPAVLNAAPERYGISLKDIERSATGVRRPQVHPEVHSLRRDRVTTGPLGQGFANGVGMAVAERFPALTLRPRDDRPPHLRDLRRRGLDGGCEATEAASLAGNLGLGRLRYISTTTTSHRRGPPTSRVQTDVMKRFDAYGWHVERLGEVANDLDALEGGAAPWLGRGGPGRRCWCSAVILAGPPRHRTDTKEAHGDPLGAEEIRPPKRSSACLWTRSSTSPTRSRRSTRNAPVWDGPRARHGRIARQSRRATRSASRPALAGRALAGWAEQASRLRSWHQARHAQRRSTSASPRRAQASRASSPELLTSPATPASTSGPGRGSVPCLLQAAPSSTSHREHAMASAMTGWRCTEASSLSVAPSSSSVTMPARRFASQHCHGPMSSTSSLTDSVGLGEDGPTHQPIEQLRVLAAMPGLRVIRPADATETAAAWRVAVDSDGPTA